MAWAAWLLLGIVVAGFGYVLIELRRRATPPAGPESEEIESVFIADDDDPDFDGPPATRQNR
jgi:hypothetical protein